MQVSTHMRISFATKIQSSDEVHVVTETTRFTLWEDALTHEDIALGEK
jgi:hypothetical protein